MGTRGACGFRLDGMDYLTYNHYDSYPEGLGACVLDFCKNIPDDVKEKVRELNFFNPKTYDVTDEDVRKCSGLGLTDLEVSSGSEYDYYCLLRNAQGNLQAYLNAGMMPNDNEFIGDGLFCEYAYVVDLDAGTFECYKGGRNLVASWPLDTLPTEEEMCNAYYSE